MPRAGEATVERAAKPTDADGPDGPPTDVPPAVELLLWWARPPGSRVDAERVRTLVAAEPSWDRLLDLAGAHGVLPLVARAVESGPEVDVPDRVRERLESGARSATVGSLRYVDELHGIFEAFDEAAVRALPFKGPVLSARSYGDLSLRRFHDLDVLVHRADVSTAVDLLENRGYEWIRDAPRLDDSPLLGGAVTLPLVCEYVLERGDLTVEVRWRVGEPSVPFGVDFERLWARRERVAVAGVDLPALSPTDRLLTLAYHGTKHRFHLLKWIVDLAATLERTAVAWPKLFARARETGHRRQLLVGIALTRSLFGTSVPAEVTRQIQADERAEALAGAVRAEMKTPEPPTAPTPVEGLCFTAKAADSPVTAALAALKRQRLHPMAFEYERVPLPGELHALYYPAVPVRLAAERLVTAVRRYAGSADR